MLPIAAEIAVRMTRQQARSALPDAPVLPDEEPGRSRASARMSRRLRAAGLLRHVAATAARVADRIEQPVRAA
jgi:hypothetical protein